MRATFTGDTHQVETFISETHHAAVQHRADRSESGKPWCCHIFAKSDRTHLVEVSIAYGSTDKESFLEACKQANIDHESFVNFYDWMHRREKH